MFIRTTVQRSPDGVGKLLFIPWIRNALGQDYGVSLVTPLLLDSGLTVVALSFLPSAESLSCDTCQANLPPNMHQNDGTWEGVRSVLHLQQRCARVKTKKKGTVLIGRGTTQECLLDSLSPSSNHEPLSVYTHAEAKIEFVRD